jgi:hypothetical protein
MLLDPRLLAGTPSGFVLGEKSQRMVLTEASGSPKLARGDIPVALATAPRQECRGVAFPKKAIPDSWSWPDFVWRLFLPEDPRASRPIPSVSSRKLPRQPKPAGHPLPKSVEIRAIRVELQDAVGKAGVGASWEERSAWHWTERGATRIPPISTD